MALITSHRNSSYRARLNEDLSAMIESKELGISNLQKNYLRSRWLEQVLRLEYECNRATKRFRALRLLTVIGSILILMLVSLDIDAARWAAGANAAHYLTIAVSLLVCVAVAVEHFYNYGEMGRQSERLVERLKAEGWRFLQLSGTYGNYRTHAEAFTMFANQVESLSQSHVEVYSLDMVREKKPEATEANEVESPKKLELSQRESGHLMDTPAAAAAAASMPGGVTRRLNQHRIQ